MGRRLLVMAPMLAALTCLTLAGCTGGAATIDPPANGQIRGCVPLEVRVVGQPRVQRVTLSLFAGSCAA